MRRWALDLVIDGHFALALDNARIHRIVVQLHVIGVRCAKDLVRVEVVQGVEVWAVLREHLYPVAVRPLLGQTSLGNDVHDDTLPLWTNASKLERRVGLLPTYLPNAERREQRTVRGLFREFVSR